MRFNQGQIPQPIKLPLNWAANYFNGETLTEFDLKEHTPNSFYSIRQSEVHYFGLFGNNMELYFDSVTGHFVLRGRRVEIHYIDIEGNRYRLTDNPNMKELITYKQAYVEYDDRTITQKSNVESVSFGYKTQVNQDDVSMFFQPIVCLPFNNSAYIETKITSDTSMEGHLVFYVGGREQERFYAPLESGKSGKINWTIK